MLALLRVTKESGRATDEVALEALVTGIDYTSHGPLSSIWTVSQGNTQRINHSVLLA